MVSSTIAQLPHPSQQDTIYLDVPESLRHLPVGRYVFSAAGHIYRHECVSGNPLDTATLI